MRQPMCGTSNPTDPARMTSSINYILRRLFFVRGCCNNHHIPRIIIIGDNLPAGTIRTSIACFFSTIKPHVRNGANTYHTNNEDWSYIPSYFCGSSCSSSARTCVYARGFDGLPSVQCSLPARSPASNHFLMSAPCTCAQPLAVWWQFRRQKKTWIYSSNYFFGYIFCCVHSAESFCVGSLSLSLAHNSCAEI